MRERQERKRERVGREREREGGGGGEKERAREPGQHINNYFITFSKFTCFFSVSLYYLGQHFTTMISILAGS